MRKITWFLKVSPFGCSSLLNGETILYSSKVSSNLLILSCKTIGTLFARCFLKTASSYRGRCNGEFTFSTSNLDVA